MTFEKIANLLADYKGIDASAINENTTFAELQLDSLDVAELVMNIEDEFGITLELDENVKNVSSLIKAIEEANV